MWDYLNSILVKFRPCFSREAAFCSFVIVVIGFMLNTDNAGITSIIRTLSLEPGAYDSLVHFFRSSAWNLTDVRIQWIRIVRDSGTMFTEDGVPILVGDGVKQSKEGRRMPGVKRLHQESENSSKPEFILGHMFGAIGILVGNVGKLHCLPLFASVHDGDKEIRRWQDAEYEPVSHVVQMIRDAFFVTAELGKTISILLADAYYFSAEALKELERQKSLTKHDLILVTRARQSTVAYEQAPPQKGKGRPRKKGAQIKLKELFDTEEFIQTKAWLYGIEETVQYLCKDLLWGMKIYTCLRFVLVKHGDKKVILVSTDLSLTAEQIIRLYGYRFRIEVTFRTMKQLVKAFSYHFWTKYMPKLNRFTKKGENDPLMEIKGEKERRKILKTFNAIENYVMMGIIANGLLQLLCLKYSPSVKKSSFCWLRTNRSESIVSETTMFRFLRRDIFMQFAKQAYLPILQIIRSRMSSSYDSDLPGAA